MINEILRPIFVDGDLAPEEEIDGIIEMFCEDKIDLMLFISNIEALCKNPSQYGNQTKPTPSIKHFIQFLNRALSFPLWFYAAYPDIMAWFNKQNANEDTALKLLGIDPSMDNEKKVFN